ncbi:MAG: hypothetical protein HY652_04510 [Acidobacteria bacterium]|nr:hypothetical protein [Acidobacteriota bacterium]
MRPLILWMLCFSLPVRADSRTAWLSLSPLGVPRQEVGVAELNGKIYVVGGILPDRNTSNAVEAYDPKTDRWETLPSLPQPLHHAAAAGGLGKLYVIGGLAGAAFTATSSVFEFDPSTQSWTAKASLPTPRGALALAVLQGKIYAVGGARGPSVADFAVFDPQANQWTSLPDLPIPRDHLAAATVGGKIYALSGRRDGTNLANVDEYDPASNQWRAMAPIPTARSGIAASVLDNRIWVFGGEGNPASPLGIFSEVEAFDPASNQWMAGEGMITARHGIGAAVLGNRIFIPGGAPREGFSVTAVHEAFVLLDKNLFFAHLADEGGLKTEVLLVNPSSTDPVAGTVELYDPSGQPLSLVINGSAQSRIPFLLPPLGSQRLKSSGTGSAIRTGSARAFAERNLAGSLLFSGSAGAAGVGASPSLKSFVAPVRKGSADGVNTGIAVANLEGSSATLQISLRNIQGQEAAITSVNLAGNGQISRFLDQLFQLAGDFEGILSVSSNKSVAPVALITLPGHFATLPVTEKQ